MACVQKSISGVIVPLNSTVLYQSLSTALIWQVPVFIVPVSKDLWSHTYML